MGLATMDVVAPRGGEWLDRNLRKPGSRQSGGSNAEGIFLLVLISVLLAVVVFCCLPKRCLSTCLPESLDSDAEGIESVFQAAAVEEATRKCDIRACLQVEASPLDDAFASNKGRATSSSCSTDKSRDGDELRRHATHPRGVDPTCAICLEGYRAGERTARARNGQCSHQFHEDCVTRWLLKHNECPCCRINFLEGYTVHADDDEVEENVVLEQGLAIFDRLQRGPEG